VRQTYVATLSFCRFNHCCEIPAMFFVWFKICGRTCGTMFCFNSFIYLFFVAVSEVMSWYFPGLFCHWPFSIPVESLFRNPKYLPASPPTIDAVQKHPLSLNVTSRKKTLIHGMCVAFSLCNLCFVPWCNSVVGISSIETTSAVLIAEKMWKSVWDLSLYNTKCCKDVITWKARC